MAQSTFTPNPMQSELMATAWNDPEVQNILLAGGSRGGKSAGIMALVVMRALAAPNTKHGIFRLTLTNCNKQLGPARGTFPEVLDLLFPGKRQQWEKLPDVGTFKNDSIFRFPNGSEILFEGLDKTRIDNVLELKLAGMLGHEAELYNKQLEAKKILGAAYGDIQAKEIEGLVQQTRLTSALSAWFKYLQTTNNVPYQPG